MRSANTEADYYPYASDKLLLRCAAVYLVTVIMEGPLRWGLHLVGLETALYLRDPIALVPAAVAIVAWFAGRESFPPLIAALGVLVLHLFIGLLSLPTAGQAFFGFKAFIPMLMGMAIAPILQRRREVLLRFCAVSLAVTCVGVVGNSQLEYPWLGVSYDTAFGETATARIWWDGLDGALRLPGFSRSSVSAATISLAALPPLLAANKSPWGKAIWVAISCVSIHMTTSKGPLMAVPGVLIQVLLLQVVGSGLLSGVFLAIITIGCLATPFLAMIYVTSRKGVPEILLSFMDRIEDEWPRAFQLYESNGQVLWGRGLGGIGTAQTFGEWSKHCAGDNYMIFVLVTFGVLGLIYTGYFLYRAAKLTSQRPTTDFDVRLLHAWTAAWIMDGFVSAMIEDQVAGAMIGVLCGIAFGAAQSPRPVSTLRVVQSHAAFEQPFNR